ncbi:hypothetical protein JR316_0008983 [Psilocybe cubensis]|uniref:RING-type domain-containing protein n=2 Tax=Psilocybe cubensis TaxID=181762 RepID=A0A8H7XYA5_PSICU|nr:hypothetical protein JR316_0008983 [Psilocybe cubensis]KAH9478528.1 hypothetical protein JR316_0008983 [Psilocybe cubensis]
MPRSANGTGGGGASTTGYDAVPVCAFCIELLNITAAGRHQLKTMSLAKLKKYINSYNIKIDRAVEKDDLIDAIISAKAPNGCLPPANENYYRKYSVPNKPPGRARGFFSRQQGPSSAQNTPPPVPPRSADNMPEFARPDLAPDGPPPPPPPPHATYPPPPPQQQQQQQGYNWQHHPPQPPPRPRSAYGNSAPPPQQPAPGFGYNRPPPPPPQQQYHQQQAPPPPPPPHHSRPPPPQNYQTRPTPRYPSQPPPPPSHTHPQSFPHAYSYGHAHPPPQPQNQYHYHQYTQPPPPPPRQRAASTPSHPPAAATPTPPPPPPPTLDELLAMPTSDISALSISALKAILFTNHVPAGHGQILEKGDLVRKVVTLVEDERAERERMRRIEEREEMERLQREQERREEEERVRMEREEGERERERRAAERARMAQMDGSGGASASASGEGEGGAGEAMVTDEPSASAADSAPQAPTPTPAPAPTRAPPKTQGSASTLERTGLCVICQDEEANIAIVDCGHMAMCRGCSDLVMASSRECPLCRTRIVTEARLLRIFKT